MRFWMSGGWVLLLAAVVLSACDASGGADMDDQEAADVARGATATIDSLFAATNDRDPDRALTHYLPSAELVQVACTTIRQGYAERERIVRLWHEDRPETTIRHEIVGAQVLAPNAAVVAARGWASDGTPLFWTFVLRRDAGADWRVVQEHQSWPGCREVRDRSGPSPHGQ